MRRAIAFVSFCALGACGKALDVDDDPVAIGPDAGDDADAPTPEKVDGAADSSDGRVAPFDCAGAQFCDDFDTTTPPYPGRWNGFDPVNGGSATVEAAGPDGPGGKALHITHDGTLGVRVSPVGSLVGKGVPRRLRISFHMKRTPGEASILQIPETTSGETLELFGSADGQDVSLEMLGMSVTVKVPLPVAGWHRYVLTIDAIGTNDSVIRLEIDDRSASHMWAVNLTNGVALLLGSTPLTSSPQDVWFDNVKVD
ncbi:MAG: hypothetical protein KF819_29880 [Labilithrix sp.]|nr:hypothetical protein [Labilithrix sp.]